MPKTTDNNQKMYHINLSKNDLNGATLAILPGDPGRVEKIAAMFDEYQELTFNREYKSILAKLDNSTVLICSTGMGGPSLAICVEELATIGIERFVRVGTTGSIREDIAIGDLVISNAAVRLDGTSTHYAPIEYPAVADITLTNALIATAKEQSFNHHVGIAVSSDTFYPGQERYNNFNGYVRRAFQGSMEEWRKLGALNYEMEIASLFVVAKVFSLQAAAVCMVVAKRTENESVANHELIKQLESNFFRYIKSLTLYLVKNKI